MAAFLARALVLPAADASFADISGSVFENDIAALSGAGITRGCDPPANTRFCPEDHVTRAQMAGFLVRAFGYPAAADQFVDTGGSVFGDDIAALAAAGVTRGCDPPANTRFCPRRNVTRAEMASFLVRALGLSVPTPPSHCPTLPPDDIWNTAIDDLPLDPRSADYVSSIGADRPVHPDFGSGGWPPGSTSPIGIPFVEVPAATPTVPIHFTATARSPTRAHTPFLAMHPSKVVPRGQATAT
ncbi:hypothetical protein BH23ACT5_BH23ACT5_01260 [soil metagenome]